MSQEKTVEILCPACEQETLLVRQPKYEGFTRVGESLSCASCGHEFVDEEEVPFKHREKPAVFTDGDRPDTVEVFEEDENVRLCLHCANYVVNPFTQWCSVHKKEVEATDTCDRFAPRPDEDEAT